MEKRLGFSRLPSFSWVLSPRPPLLISCYKGWKHRLHSSPKHPSPPLQLDSPKSRNRVSWKTSGFLRKRIQLQVGQRSIQFLWGHFPRKRGGLFSTRTYWRVDLHWQVVHSRTHYPGAPRVSPTSSTNSVIHRWSPQSSSLKGSCCGLLHRISFLNQLCRWNAIWSATLWA